MYPGSMSVFDNFMHFDLTLAALTTGYKLYHWQRALAACRTMLPALRFETKQIRISIHLGSLEPGRNSTQQMQKLGDIIIRMRASGQDSVLDLLLGPPGQSLSGAELAAHDARRRVLESAELEVREARCKGVLIVLFIVLARVLRANLCLEKSDGRESRSVNVNSLPAFLQLAAEIDNGWDLWLVMESSPVQQRRHSEQGT